jgi:hypothetical protein
MITMGYANAPSIRDVDARLWTELSVKSMMTGDRIKSLQGQYSVAADPFISNHPADWTKTALQDPTFR